MWCGDPETEDGKHSLHLMIQSVLIVLPR